ncbi:hypothetical protein Poly30_53230 [Planctomycetes bacterium Poly30]|uniref:Tetratricopeptide repeat protein n=1 Tax=Saltatorellus ferox TaxID=2528018 RepID=A0A518F094_9BACT|nr:hypothetical protein Poly30_53230 [Planctomycetes bacterium Poly30]
MRKLLIGLWLLLPVAAWAYHEGPGQERMALDATDAKLTLARAAAAKGDWPGAILHFEAAAKEMPALDTPERVTMARQIRLSMAKAKLNASQLVDARRELKDLVKELGEDSAVAGDPARSALLDEAREAHANAQYYWTWLMRLEGAPRTEWEPEVEVARQTYRLLAEEADARGESKSAVSHMEDLEATVKLARLDLEELQGLPLPSQ